MFTQTLITIRCLAQYEANGLQKFFPKSCDGSKKWRDVLALIGFRLIPALKGL